MEFLLFGTLNLTEVRDGDKSLQLVASISPGSAWPSRGWKLTERVIRDKVAISTDKLCLWQQWQAKKEREHTKMSLLYLPVKVLCEFTCFPWTEIISCFTAVKFTALTLPSTTLTCLSAFIHPPSFSSSLLLTSPHPLTTSPPILSSFLDSSSFFNLIISVDLPLYLTSPPLS